MNPGATVAKYILFFINLIFVLAGLAFAGLGAFGICVLNQSNADNMNEVLIYPVVLLVLGLFVFMVAFCGCCGSIKEVKCLLIMYAIIMVLMAAVKIFFTVKVVQGDLVEAARTMINTTFDNDLNKFSVIEKFLKCCGTTGPDSYTVKPLPPTCCAHPENNKCLTSSYEGCLSVVSGVSKTYGTNIAYSAIAIIAFEFVATIFALCVTCAI